MIKLFTYEDMIKEHATKYIKKDYYGGIRGRKSISHFSGFCDDCDMIFLNNL